MSGVYFVVLLGINKRNKLVRVPLICIPEDPLLKYLVRYIYIDSNMWLLLLEPMETQLSEVFSMRCTSNSSFIFNSFTAARSENLLYNRIDCLILFLEPLHLLIKVETCDSLQFVSVHVS